MGQFKPWQIVLVVAAVVAVGASLYLSFFAGAPRIENLATESRMIDVNTGQIFVFPLGGRKGIIVPATNPDTGTATLLTVVDEGGVLKIAPRDLPALEYLQGGLAAVVDRQTGQVKSNGAAPRRVR